MKIYSIKLELSNTISIFSIYIVQNVDPLKEKDGMFAISLRSTP